MKRFKIKTIETKNENQNKTIIINAILGIIFLTMSLTIAFMHNQQQKAINMTTTKSTPYNEMMEMTIKDQTTAREFLKYISNYTEFNAPVENLRFASREDSDETVTYIFKQMYEHIPVINGFVTVTTDKDGKVDNFSINLKKIPEGVSTKPSLTKEKRSEIIKQYNLNKIKSKKVVVAIYEYQNNPILVYYIKTNNNEILINANTGKTIYIKEIAKEIVNNQNTITIEEIARDIVSGGYLE